MSWKTFPLRTRTTRMITPNVLAATFERDDGEDFEFNAGQFVNVHFDNRDGVPVHRSYSIANPPGSGTIELAVAPVEGGLATELFFGLKPGDVISGSGPYGRFVLRDEPPCRYVLAATGTGATPYRAMLPELRRRVVGGYRVDMLVGVWNRDELLYGEDFVAFAREHDNVTLRACYSRVQPDDPEPHEVQGYVQHHFDALDLDPESDVIYLCGNPDMIDEAVAMLREKGFPTRNLRREKYLPARL